MMVWGILKRPVREFNEYDVVELAKVERPAASYDGWKLNCAAPTVGERGTIVHMYERNGEWWYVVEGPMVGNRPTWLGDFRADEIRIPPSD